MIKSFKDLWQGAYICLTKQEEDTVKTRILAMIGYMQAEIEFILSKVDIPTKEE